MRNALFVAVAIAAACAPAAEQQAAAPAAPDTAAVRVSIQALGDSWAALAMAGDAAGIAALFTEDGTAAFFGFPTTTGRANIQAFMAGLFAAGKVTSAKATVVGVTAPAPGIATAGGTYMEVVDSSGVTITNWWRWAAAYRQAPDGTWLTAYDMAFQDSTARK
jgi:uncharacterized protein (TIGR02246 family)